MVVGFSSGLKNVGSMNNRGVELDISADVFKDSQIRWNTGLALSHNRNKRASKPIFKLLFFSHTKSGLAMLLGAEPGLS